MSLSQRALAAFFTFAGIMHFVIPREYEATVPDYVPISPRDAVAWSGYAEIAGGLMVLLPATRPVARWWLLALLAAVFPANIHMAVDPRQVQGLKNRGIPRAALWARLPLQFACMWWVWLATER